MGFADRCAITNVPMALALMDSLISLQIYFLFIMLKLDYLLLRNTQYYSIDSLVLKIEKRSKYILYNKTTMRKNQPNSIFDNIKQRQTSANKQTISHEHNRINYDQIVTDYLHFSLSGQIKDQLQFTKLWLKNNKKQAKIAVRKAEKDLQTSLTSKHQPIKQLFDDGNRTMSHLIVSNPVKLLNVNVFNERQMQRIITQRQKQADKCQKKVKHLQKIDNYLKQISKLNFAKRRQSKPTIDKQNQLQTESNNQSFRLRTQGSFNKKTEPTMIEGNKTTQEPLNYLSLNSSGFERKTCSPGKVSPFKREKLASYHPFLQKNSAMLYESKKKSYTNKKFRLNKHKASIYY